MSFEQQDFEYKDLYAENSYISDIIKHFAADEHYQQISADLSQFSKKTVTEFLDLAHQAEANPPNLTQFDHWGKRIDEIIVHPSWDELHRVAAREGLVAIGYERSSGADSRLHQFLKLTIFHPSSAFYTCPLAMTDGAARLLELKGKDCFENYFVKLTSRDPNEFCTAGQWMTEKKGGSDVSQSETVAEKIDGTYYLTGEKWFTSAVTSEVAMALAQTGEVGSQRLSLFLLKVKDDRGQLNNIQVLRLKDKLGTKAMPTAELKLDGVKGDLIGELGHGVREVSTILNISRLYNSVCATGTSYRLHSLARDYAKKRTAFSAHLIDHPLHQITLLRTQSDIMASLQFCSYMAILLGRSETGVATAEEGALLRLFTPVIKMWTGKKAVETVSELIETFGGAGYIEDTQLPRFLRDAQVFPIWEGTTNIMSLDILRVLGTPKVWDIVYGSLNGRLQSLSASGVDVNGTLRQQLECCNDWLKNNINSRRNLEQGARLLATGLGELMGGLLLFEFFLSTEKERDRINAEVFVGKIAPPNFSEAMRSADDYKAALLT